LILRDPGTEAIDVATDTLLGFALAQASPAGSMISAHDPRVFIITPLMVMLRACDLNPRHENGYGSWVDASAERRCALVRAHARHQVTSRADPHRYYPTTSAAYPIG